MAPTAQPNHQQLPFTLGNYKGELTMKIITNHNDKELKNSYGIYAFMTTEGDILYVGSTTVSFKHRLMAYELKIHNYELQELIRNGQVFMKILRAFSTKEKFSMTTLELLKIEAMLVQTLQPKCNKEFKILDFEKQLANNMELGRLTPAKHKDYDLTIAKIQGLRKDWEF